MVIEATEVSHLFSLASSSIRPFEYKFKKNFHSSFSVARAAGIGPFPPLWIFSAMLREWARRPRHPSIIIVTVAGFGRIPKFIDSLASSRLAWYAEQETDQRRQQARQRPLAKLDLARSAGLLFGFSWFRYIWEVVGFRNGHRIQPCSENENEKVGSRRQWAENPSAIISSSHDRTHAIHQWYSLSGCRFHVIRIILFVSWTKRFSLNIFSLMSV